MKNWISLFEYSVKYGVSMSTLRRRLKSNSILFRLDGGKYFLLDQAEQEKPTVQPPAPQPQSQPKQLVMTAQTSSASPIQESLSSAGFVEASVLSSANRLVEELKSAYAKILQEKEEQIGILKEEILDLKMLVNILETQVKKAEEKQISSAPMNTETFFFPEIAD